MGPIVHLCLHLLGSCCIRFHDKSINNWHQPKTYFRNPKNIYIYIMISLLIWVYSNFMLTPKLMNKQCCFSISRPSFCQRMKSRKNLNFSLSEILLKNETSKFKWGISLQLWFTWDHMSPILVRVRTWELTPASWSPTLILLFWLESLLLLDSEVFEISLENILARISLEKLKPHDLF